jgi:tetratricopeptide (TPR) repeat protein
LELFQRANDTRGRIGALSNLCFQYAFAGKTEDARRCGEEALGLARQCGYRLMEASTLENLAAAEGSAGEFDRAIEYAEASFDLRSRSQSQVWSGQTLGDVAIWYARRGNLPAARAAIQKMLADEAAIPRGNDWPEYCYWAASQIFHLEGRSVEAKRALDKSNRIMQRAAGGLDPEDRTTFFALPFHVDMRRTAETGIWPDPPRSITSGV